LFSVLSKHEIIRIRTAAQREKDNGGKVFMAKYQIFQIQISNVCQLKINYIVVFTNAFFIMKNKLKTNN
jgi:hypothetical protein